MEYTKEDYKADLNNPEMPHLKSRERFNKFYDHLGAGEQALAVQYPAHRMDWIKPTKGGLILELGCHAGYDIVKWLTEDKEAQAVGIDISEPLLKEASERCKAAGIVDRVSLYKAFIEDLPKHSIGKNLMPTDIVLTETLEHVQDPLAVLKATKHFMVFDTSLWISVPNHRWGNFSHVRGLNSEQLTKLLEEAGFKKEGIEFMEEKDSTTFAKIVL